MSLGLRSRGVLAVGVVLATVGACKQDGVTQTCMNMTGQSQLVDDAATLRVAVYDGSVPCSGIGNATPIVVKEFAKGAGIELDVKAGTRTIVLTAIDSSGLAIGQACTTAALGKGSNLCFDLVVQPLAPPDLLGADLPVTTDGGTDGGAVDLAVAVDLSAEPDLAVSADLLPPTDLKSIPDLIPSVDLKPECTVGTVGTDCPLNSLCCNNKCVANNTATNCGACGEGCNAANGSADCITGSCVVACKTGFDDCDKKGSNGCEVDLNEDPNHCGSCTRACSTTETNVLDCTNGTCNSTCTANHQNCSEPQGFQSDNGCECEGTACCNTGSCQGKHNTGTGQTWYNCVPTSTRSPEQAMESCQQYAGTESNNCKELKCGSDSNEKIVCNTSRNGANGCCCWWFNGSQVGEVRCRFDGDACSCANPTLTWN